jgi:hypothetical protein
MDGFDLLVINGLVVTASDTAHYDIAIKNGKIALLAPPGLLDKDKANKVIDAEGGYVTVSGLAPGIDLPLQLLKNLHGLASSQGVSTPMSISKSRHFSEARADPAITSRQVRPRKLVIDLGSPDFEQGPDRVSVEVQPPSLLLHHKQSICHLC